LPLEVFSQRNFAAHFIQLKLTFIPKTGKLGISTPHLGELGTTHDLRLWLVGKRVGDFLFVIIELYSLARTVETLQAEICGHRRFSKVGGSLRSPILGGRAHRLPTAVGWQKTRRIALSCGIKISLVGSLD